MPVIATGWVYILLGAGIEGHTMDMGGGHTMVMMLEWTPGYAAIVLLMWVVMMTAMMLPGAAPVVIQVASLAQNRAERNSGMVTAAFFAAGYLMVWIGFSIAATFLQWAFDSEGLLSDTMAIRDAPAKAVVLVEIGLYQLTPLKQSCLRDCRSWAGCLAPDQHQAAWVITLKGIVRRETGRE
jgi:predicted metal-binding membrane protein